MVLYTSLLFGFDDTGKAFPVQPTGVFSSITPPGLTYDAPITLQTPISGVMVRPDNQNYWVSLKLVLMYFDIFVFHF